MFFEKGIVEVIANRQKIITGAVRFFLALAVLGSIYELNWMALFVSFLALVLSFSPEFFRRRYRIVLPRFLQAFIIVFVFAALFLGEVRSFYLKYWWWDSLLHLLSGIALGFAGFLIVYILRKTGKFMTSPALLATLAFCFALAMGALWEIFEYLTDQFFRLDMQKARNLCEVGAVYCDTRLGVADTMRDLILDAIGALYASITGYFYLLRKKFSSSFLHGLIKEFEEKNRHLFAKKKRWPFPRRPRPPGTDRDD